MQNSTLLPLNGIFMLIVAATAVAVIIYWWAATRGSWMGWPAGRSLMGLLAIIALITGWAGLNTFILPQAYEGKVASYFGLYGLFEVALIIIGITIHRELKRGAARVRAAQPPTGPLDVTVATLTEETPMSNPVPGVVPPTPSHRAAGASNAFWRTFLQVGPAAALSLLVILPPVLQSILDGFGRQLPADLYGVLASITAGLTLTAAILAKVMARPDVQAWLTTYAPFFAATKKGTP